MLPPEDLDRTSELAAGLSRLSARLRVQAILNVVSVLVPIATVLAALLTQTGLTWAASAAICGVMATAVAVAWLMCVRPRWGASMAARALEVHSNARNVVITGEELLRHPDRAAPSIRARVIAQSADIVSRTRAAEAVRLTRPAWVALAALMFSAAVVTRVPERAARLAMQTARDVAGSTQQGGSTATTVVATIVPPAYTREGPRTIQNPDRIEALQGSTLSLSVRGGGSWRLRFGSDVLDTRAAGDSTEVDLPLVRSGYVAIEPADSASGAARRLLPVAVIPDRAPAIRVEKPGKDLLLPDATPVVGVAAAATDDFGLQSLELRYTKVSGSGEQFEFKEGTLPLSISRDSPRDWKARADLALSAIGLAPGDAMIYRIVGRDERPGDAGVASSDTFFIEVAGPGQVALAGFELPPDRERYALSQQMIVLKLVRLRAREKTLDRAVLEQEVVNIAAEQRAVRANFVFLMGGQIEDEEAEAEHSHEIQEGRLENTARREIVDAIQHMGKVEIGLAAVDTAAALPPARAAVEALQRAFGRNRYILRTLPVRSRVDPSRRLAGDTSSASDWRRERSPLPPDAVLEAARRILGRLLDLAPSIASDSAPAPALTSLAEDALSVDPASETWQLVSKGLIQLRDVRGTASERSSTLNETVGRIAAVIDRVSLSTRPIERDRALQSAWSEGRRP